MVDTSCYSYSLPRELIARYPVERGMERLLVVERQAGMIRHLKFHDILSYLNPGDVLVMNDTRVIPARLTGRRETGGKVEVLLVKRIKDTRWECLIKTSKKMRPGTIILLELGITATVEKREGDGYVVAFSDTERLFDIGTIPLPPYIDRDIEESDADDYQTVYARHDGSVASPTAGLHFTGAMIEDIGSKGIDLAFVTLHIGPGTFTPVRKDNVEDHIMHPEEFRVTEQASKTINDALYQGRRIIAVGTTTTRVLEHLMHSYGAIVPGSGSTDLFIYNGFVFKSVSALLTNFHLPCSTLLMLTCAFGGHELIMEAYRQALERRYRFFSYGDAMLII